MGFIRWGLETISMEVNGAHNLPIQANQRAHFPASTDPRLNRPRLPLNSSSFPRSQPSITPSAAIPGESQQHHAPLNEDFPQALRGPPEATQKPDENPLDFAGVMPTLLELIDVRSASKLQIEKRKIFEKDEASNQHDLAKAKQTRAFPATIDCLQAVSTTNQKRLSEINSDLNQLQGRSTELTEFIGRFFRQTINSPTSQAQGLIHNAPGTDQSMAKLEDDVRSIKRTILIKQEGNLPDKPIDIAKVSNTVESQSKAHTVLRRSINALQEWKSATGDEFQQLKETQSRQTEISSSYAIDQPDITKELSDLAARLKAIEEKVTKHDGSVDGLSAEQAGIKNSSTAMQKLLERRIITQEQQLTVALGPITQRCEDLSKTVSLLESSRQQQGPASESNSGLREKISDFEKEIMKMNENWEDLRRRVPYLLDASKDIQKHIQINENLATAVRSLEHRWNNLNTEPLVKQMANAMQQMYPSAYQLLEEVNALKRVINKDFIPIKTKMGTLATTATKLDLVNKEHTDQFARIKSDQHEISTNMKDHLDKITHLQSRFDSLSNALNKQTRICLDNAATSDKNSEAAKTKSNDLEKELQNLETRTKATQNLLEELRKHPSTEDTSNAAKAQALYNDMKELLDKGKSQMADLLAEVNKILASQTKVLADAQEPSEPIQDRTQGSEPALTSETTTHTRRSSSSVIQHNGNPLPRSPLKTGMSIKPAHSNDTITAQSEPNLAATKSQKRMRVDAFSDNDDSSSAGVTPSDSPARSSASDTQKSKKAKKNKIP